MPLPHQLRTSSSNSTLQFNNHITGQNHIDAQKLNTFLAISLDSVDSSFRLCCYIAATSTLQISNSPLQAASGTIDKTSHMNTHAHPNTHIFFLLIAISGNDASHIHGCQQCQPIVGRHSNSLSQATHLCS